MKRLCVFCGSSSGARPDYVSLARELGEEMVARGIGLVYGGSSIGIMGELARIVSLGGGSVTGVITRQLYDKEIAFTDLTDLRVVETMHERKAMMADLSDGFIALPGGFGTMEEIFEALTWAQLRIHEKPCGFLNACGYYDKMIEFIEHMVEQQFVKSDCRHLVKLETTPAALLEKFRDHQPLTVDKIEVLSLPPAV